MISFKGEHFQKVILLASVRWYLAYKLSYRDIVNAGVKPRFFTAVSQWLYTILKSVGCFGCATAMLYAPFYFISKQGCLA